MSKETVIGALERGSGRYFPGAEAAATRESTIPLLRNQQADFEAVRREISRQNAWMAIPALAPEAAVALAEIVGMAALRFAKPIKPGPLDLPPPPAEFKGGENIYTRYGKAQHKELRAKADAKDLWDGNPSVKHNGVDKYPDAGLPVRDPNKSKKYLELKPDTRSGRKAGKSQAQAYREASDNPDNPNRVRIIYYKRPF